MNTPTMSSDQLTPKLSPTMLHLDDNLPSLAPPSFMYLDDNKQYPTMYRTSLSKLADRGRQGRSRQSTPTTPTKLLRSASPIRTMLNNPPKMLKPEYIAPSKLFGKGLAPIATPSMILKSSKLNFGTASTKSSNKVNSHSRGLSNASVATSEATACESCNKASESKVSIPSVNGISSGTNTIDYKLLSETSTASSTSTLDLKELPNDLQFEMPMTKNEFILATQSKRSSYISSVGSTQDDDLGGWFSNYTEEGQSALVVNEVLHPQEELLKSENSLQTEHLALRVKQLELQVTELRLQNNEMRHSMMAHRTIQDKCMFDAFHDAQREKERTQRDMDRKMKQLKKQIENYKMVIKKLTSPIKTTPVSKPRVQILDASTLDDITEIDTSDDDSINTSTDSSGDEILESSSTPRKTKPTGFDLKVSLASQ